MTGNEQRPPQARAKPGPEPDRKDRLKAALKANLARRKAQVRARSRTAAKDGRQNRD